MSDCGLDERANEVRSPAEAKVISSILGVQTGSRAHPASYPMGMGGTFPGGKARQGVDADPSPLSSAEVKNEKEIYFLSTQALPWRLVGQLKKLNINVWLIEKTQFWC
jgi:hypothetical protein